jgi:hypothetical protein
MSGNMQINDFANINNLIGDGQATLQLTGNNNLLVITGVLQGFIDDPTTFVGFNTFSANNSDSTRIIFNTPASFDSLEMQAIISGVTLQFRNIDFIGNVITQINGTFNSQINTSVTGASQNTGIPPEAYNQSASDSVMFSGSSAESAANAVITIGNTVGTCTDNLSDPQSQTTLVQQSNSTVNTNCN